MSLSVVTILVSAYREYLVSADSGNSIVGAALILFHPHITTTSARRLAGLVQTARYADPAFGHNLEPVSRCDDYSQ
jgi:hypothetical protein